MSKKLNIIEAMKMPVGTEFKVTFNGEKILSNTMKIYSVLVDKQEWKYIDWSCHPKDTYIKPYDFLINATFIPIQQPVSFMEVVNSDKKCKVDFSGIGLSEIYKERIEKFSNKYNSFGQILFDLSDCFATSDFKSIILNGKWYIEESEDDSNE